MPPVLSDFLVRTECAIGTSVSQQMGSNSPTKALVGCPVDPEEYVKLAAELTHPVDMAIQLPDHMVRAIAEDTELGALELRKTRLHFSNTLIRIADEFKGEDGCKAEHLRDIYAGKRFPVLREALKIVGYDDWSVGARSHGRL